MNPFRAILLLCLLIIFHSCKKENLIDSGNTFHRTKSEPAGFIRVFARSGEITNSSIVQRWEYNDTSNINFFAGRTSLDTIRILDNGEARLFHFSYSNYNYRVRINELKFTAKDTITQYSFLEVYTRTLPYFLSLYKPEVYKEYVISSTAGGYSFAYRTLNEYRLVKDNGHLKAPWIVALLHTKTFGTTTFVLQNKMDANFYQYLNESDTVVLREYSISYEQ